MSSASDHALRVLEFPRVLELVAELASSELGAGHLTRLRPWQRREPAEEALRAADEMASLLLRDPAWTPPPIPDARPALRRLGVRDSVLETEDLVRLSGLFRASSRIRRELLRRPDSLPRLAERARRMLQAPPVRKRLEMAFDEAGRLADRASPELARLRRELRERRADLVARLERLSAGLPERIRVPDLSVTLRNGRYCVPIRREGRARVGGIVHDESASRQTLFVEPPVAIEPMNRIRELELAELREVRRIRGELTGLVRPYREELAASLAALSELDGLFACGRYALGHGGSRPELGSAEPGEGRGVYRVVEGRHPLLLASDQRTVPFSLELDPAETVLLVSGPNAGGKTVLLKAIGLLSALAQSGIPPPVGPGTRLPVFRSFFAVIGDEQSIEASLSTFSAQMANLKQMVERSDGGSLVLVDELGGNTDPVEGAALAAAILLHLAGQAGLTVATTHLGELKALAGEDARVVNGSLQFDSRALRPGFQLRRDRPGRSYALEIAGRLGVPERILQEARRRVSVGGRALDSVLEALERREEELEKQLAAARRRLAELEQQAELARRREEGLARRELELARREAEEEKEARRKAERYLLEARELVERTIARLERQRAAAGGSRAAAADAAATARRTVEAAVRELREGAPSLPRPEPRPPLRLEPGTPVRIRSLDRVGRVRELRGDQVVIATGGVRLSVPAADVERIAGAGSARDRGAGELRAGAGGGTESRPELVIRPEVDLRGLRVDEVEAALMAALDAAILGDLPRLRIIHGKGTGAVKRRVEELLREDDRVPGFRSGSFDEGGSGVTVVEFASGPA